MAESRYGIRLPGNDGNCVTSRHENGDSVSQTSAVDALISKSAIVVPTYWSRSHGFRRPGDSTEDHPTPANEPGTMARLLASLQHLAEKPSLVLILISSSAPDVATSAAWRVDTDSRHVSGPSHCPLAADARADSARAAPFARARRLDHLV